MMFERIAAHDEFQSMILQLELYPRTDSCKNPLKILSRVKLTKPIVTNLVLRQHLETVT